MPAVKTVWEFFTRPPGRKLRDPMQDEFFNTESITSHIAAFVREVIQNILDATLDKELPARVRFFVSGVGGALEPADATPYLDGIWRHVRASMPDAAKLEKEKCPYLVVEDFNTTGLGGDHTACEEPPDKKNDFFYFWRAEGKSGKGGSKRAGSGSGSSSSPGQAGFGRSSMTVRYEGAHRGPVLMGQAVAKNHSIEGTAYEPDGWWQRSMATACRSRSRARLLSAGSGRLGASHVRTTRPV